MCMSRQLKKEKRRWITTIISAAAAALSFYAAIHIFTPSLVGALSAVSFGAFGILATFIALEGKSRKLRELFESFLQLP
jgi:ABC-type uncharacterized transport system permease subunit